MLQNPDEFWARKAQMNDDEPATPFEVNTLRAMIEHCASPSETIGPFLSLREDECSIDGKVTRVAWLVVDAAMVFPEEHERLMDLAIAMQNYPVEQIGWTEDQKRRFPDWDKWISRDEIGMLFADWRNTCWARRWNFSDESGDTVEDAARNYRNVNRWYALLFQRQENLYDLQYGLIRVRKTLEQDLQKGDDIKKESPHDLDEMYDLNVPAAASYLSITAKQIFKYVDKSSGDLGNTLQEKGELYDGEARLSRARWDFWKERLRSIGARNGLKEVSKQDIKDALAEMEKAEIAP